jgi:excisionase family DNA binding protein
VKLYDFVSVREAALRLKVSRSAIEAMIRSGALPCIQISERRRRVNFQVIIDKAV